MTEKKPSLFQILGVSPTASLAQIKEAHRALSEQLVANPSGLSREEIATKLGLIDIALNTLSDPLSREAYERKINQSNAEVRSAFQNPQTTSPADAARVLRAFEHDSGARFDPVSTAINQSASSLKKILTFIATIMAAGFVIQLVFTFFANRQLNVAVDRSSQAEDKVIIQEYYQEHGIRPASRAEVDLLEAENRRKSAEQYKETQEKQKSEREYQRFIEDSRRTADQVAEDLRRAQERARREDEQKNMQLEREKQVQEERERMRLQNERRKLGLY